MQDRGSAPRGARAEMSFEQLAQLASSVVMIMVHDKKGEQFASGSGIMIGRKGYILTNNHVLSEGSFFTVRMENDDQCYRADQIIKYNQLLDLAVIRIDRELVPLPIYNGPQKLVRGQKVVAIGSPLGLFNSVSDGIIAGFRVLDDVDMIQFTAPTSPGSSGGAVLNMYGEVIGISTAGAPGAQGINWAVGYEFINLFTQGFRN
ncbi:MAG: S1C family serine protease [Lachnospiraceae bacterium]|jgi:S1-C subfamily serine protease